MAARQTPQLPSNYAGKRIGCVQMLLGVTRALEEGGTRSLIWVTSKGDFNVSHSVCYFAGNVAAGTVRVPRCRWSDSPAVDHSGDFFGVALLQGSSSSLKMRPRLAD